jgi:hypothetical protein
LAARRTFVRGLYNPRTAYLYPSKFYLMVASHRRRSASLGAEKAIPRCVGVG